MKIGSKCEKCPLASQKGLVVNDGPETCDIVFVTDGPSSAEVFEGRPLIGPQGTLFNKVLEYNNMRREDVYITYACLCRLDAKNYKKGYQKEEINHCRERLFAEIKSKKPKIVVVLGNTAIQAVLNRKDGVTSLRGTPIWSYELDTWVTVTYNPGALMRSPKSFSDFEEDISKIRTSMYSDADALKKELETKHWVVCNPHAALQAIEFLKKQKKVSCDIETQGFDFRKHKIYSVAFSWEKGKAVVFAGYLLDDPFVRYEFKKLMECTHVKYVWQNGKFDIKFFIYQYGIQARVDEDIMLKHYATDERRGTHDLETLSQTLLGAPDFKSQFWKKWKSQIANLPPEALEELYAYNASDSDYSLRIDDKLQPRLEADGAKRAYEELLVPGSNTFAEIEGYGFYIDQKNLQEAEDKYEMICNGLREKINEAALEAGWDPLHYKEVSGVKKAPDEFNVNSWRHLGFILYDLLKLPLYKGTRTTEEDALVLLQNKVLGKPGEKYFEELYKPKDNMPDEEKAAMIAQGKAAYKEALDKWLAKGPAERFIFALLDYREKFKLYSTYVMGIKKAMQDDGRVHATFLLHGTECVSGDTLIWTDIGMCYAEDLCSKDVDEQGFAPRRLGVLAQEGRQFTSHTYVGTQRQTMHVKLGYGLTIRCTPEHPVMTDSGWIKTEDLVNGDYVKTSFGKRFFPIKPVECTSAARFIGMFLADGFTTYDEHDGHYFIAIANSDSVVYEIVAQHARQQYGLNVNFDHSNGCIKITNKRLVQEWRNIFPHNGAANKKIPSELLHFSYAEWCAFIEGCSLDSSWCLSSSGKNKPKKALIRFNSLDKHRLVVIQQALWNMGVLSSLVEVEYNTKNNVRRTGDAVVEKQYQLNITGQQTLKYLQHMHCVTARQHDMAQAFKQITYTRQGFKNCKVIQDELYVKVMDVKESGLTETVYDFTVPEVHNFTANGLIVHNTGRLASKGPNMQNIPRLKEIRNLFTVPAGYKLLAADYSQCELRTLAVLSQDPFLMQTYYDGKDLHDAVAEQLFGPGFTKEQRVRAKAVNFGKKSQGRSKIPLITVKAS